MQMNEVNQLLAPGHLPLETGYFRLPNQDMHIRILSPYPDCKGKMIEWWFGHIDNQLFKKWNPKEHVKVIRDGDWGIWKPKVYVGNSHVCVQDVGGNVMNVRISFKEPATFGFDVSQFKKAGVSCCICGEMFDDDKPMGRLIHFGRDTEYGCEMRSIFWLFKATERVTKGLFEHALVENVLLPTFLPDLYAKSSEK
jgi:hypothetical protein